MRPPPAWQEVANNAGNSVYIAGMYVVDISFWSWIAATLLYALHLLAVLISPNFPQTVSFS